MSKKQPADRYSEQETAQRRDEVVRRMANTPPQPQGKPKSHRQKKEKPADPDRAASKGRDRKKP